MLKRQLYEKLKDKLGELLFGFDENQLDVGFFGGDAKLRDLIFRPKAINEIFEKQNLPFALKAGMIAKMDIKVCVNKPSYKAIFWPIEFLLTHVHSSLCLLSVLDLSLETLFRVNVGQH